MTREELIKRMAYAMHTSAAHSSFWSVEDLRTMASAALTDIEARGLAIVPVEPTAEMMRSFFLAGPFPAKPFAPAYRAMTAAGRLA